MSETVEKEEVSAELIERIQQCINRIRPYIQQDGGDVQFVDFQNGIVTVMMLGHCVGCMSLDDTLTQGIQAILMDEIPEVEGVQLDTSFEGYDYGW